MTFSIIISGSDTVFLPPLLPPPLSFTNYHHFHPSFTHHNLFPSFTNCNFCGPSVSKLYTSCPTRLRLVYSNHLFYFTAFPFLSSSSPSTSLYLTTNVTTRRNIDPGDRSKGCQVQRKKQVWQLGVMLCEVTNAALQIITITHWEQI